MSVSTSVIHCQVFTLWAAQCQERSEASGELWKVQSESCSGPLELCTVGIWVSDPCEEEQRESAEQKIETPQDSSFPAPLVGHGEKQCGVDLRECLFLSVFPFVITFNLGSSESKVEKEVFFKTNRAGKTTISQLLSTPKLYKFASYPN